MNKLATAVLSLGLLGALSAAHAAPVTIDAGTFEFTYRDELTAGLTLTYEDGVFNLTGPGLLAAAVGGSANELATGTLSVNSYNGNPFPILITPKAGYQISGVIESVLGTFNAAAGVSEESMSVVTAGLVSRWVYVDGTESLGQNDPYTVAAMLGAGQGAAQGNFIASGALDFQSFNFAPGAVALSALDVSVASAAFGDNSYATGVLNTYRIGVNVSPVPEADDMVMVLAGLGIVGFAVRRRRAR